MSFNKILKYAVPAAFISSLPFLANAADSANLKSDDFVGISFWLISMALVASTAFFFMETQRVSAKWKTSLTVSGLVTLVAAVHYFYMRDVWVGTGETPTVYRYIDWLITVPLLMVEFYIILRACTAIAGGVFWKNTGPGIAHLEKIVIAPHYRNSYLSIRLAEELFNRLRLKKFEFLTVGFFQSGLFYKLGFEIDQKFSGLVKRL